MMRAPLFVVALASIGLAACHQDTVSPSPLGPGTVTAKLTSLVVSGPALGAGASAPFKATGHFEGGTVEDLTSVVLWQSSNPAVATVSPAGVVTALSPGPVDIRAAFHFSSSKITLLITGSGTYLMFASDPGDPVGLGHVGFQTAINDCGGTARQVCFFVTTRGTDAAPDGEQVQLSIIAPAGLELLAGTYEDARLFGTQPAGSAGLIVRVAGRACTALTGRVVAHETLFGGGVSRIFIASFEQRCAGRTETLRGEIRYVR